ncbi:hypothetical protein AAC387_Pa03g0377 [Persea americana]
MTIEEKEGLGIKIIGRKAIKAVGWIRERKWWAIRRIVLSIITFWSLFHSQTQKEMKVERQNVCDDWLAIPPAHAIFLWRAREGERCERTIMPSAAPFVCWHQLSRRQHMCSSST